MYFPPENKVQDNPYIIGNSRQTFIEAGLKSGNVSGACLNDTLEFKWYYRNMAFGGSLWWKDIPSSLYGNGTSNILTVSIFILAYQKSKYFILKQCFKMY